jgi:fructose-1,6-bisphosphatase/inositol monophosphatase family enzyme
MDLSRVPALLERASRELLLPRFTRLAAGDVQEKSPGEWVTIADHDVEAFLSDELKKLAPHSRMVGEEACSADPTQLDNLQSEQCWVIDPLDGTSNFVAGRHKFGILLGYLEHGRCMASWIYQPIGAQCFSAASGISACNGKQLKRAGRAGGLRGIIKTRFLPAGLREHVLERAASQNVEVLPGVNSTACEYPDVARGELDFVLYWRTLAWDHVPCVHFLDAAGGFGRRIDGSEYDPTDRRDGLLVARDEDTWHRARSVLFG